VSCVCVCVCVRRRSSATSAVGVISRVITTGRRRQWRSLLFFRPRCGPLMFTRIYLPGRRRRRRLGRFLFVYTLFYLVFIIGIGPFVFCPPCRAARCLSRKPARVVYYMVLYTARNIYLPSSSALCKIKNTSYNNNNIIAIIIQRYLFRLHRRRRRRREIYSRVRLAFRRRIYNAYNIIRESRIM